VVYQYAVTQEEDASAQYVDRGAGGDYYRSTLAMAQNHSKAAAIMDYITGTARSAAFSITTPSGHYPFSREKTDGTFSVRIAQPIITLTNQRHNEWLFDLTLAYISGPT